MNKINFIKKPYTITNLILTLTLLVFLGVSSSRADVSAQKHNALVKQYNRLAGKYKKSQIKYNELVDDWNKLKDKYNQLVTKNNTIIDENNKLAKKREDDLIKMNTLGREVEERAMVEKTINFLGEKLDAHGSAKEWIKALTIINLISDYAEANKTLIPKITLEEIKTRVKLVQASINDEMQKK